MKGIYGTRLPARQRRLLAAALQGPVLIVVGGTDTVDIVRCALVNVFRVRSRRQSCCPARDSHCRRLRDLKLLGDLCGGA